MNTKQKQNENSSIFIFIYSFHSGNDLKNFTSNRTVGIQSNGNNAWHDPYNTNKGTPESNEWNGVPNENGQQDESNTWSSGNSNQRYNQYRQGSGNYRSTNNKST